MARQSLSKALTDQDREAFRSSSEGYRRTRRGRAGTGAREVQAWWPEIEAALRDGHSQKRIWRYLRSLSDPGERPLLTIQYRRFNTYVSRRLEAQRKTGSQPPTDPPGASPQPEEASPPPHAPPSSKGAEPGSTTTAGTPDIIAKLTRRVPRSTT